MPLLNTELHKTEFFNYYTIYYKYMCPVVYIISLKSN